MTITDEQLQEILAYWSDAATSWHRDFFDLVASGKPLDDPSDSAASLWVVMQALRQRDATIAELRDRIGEHIGYATETSEDMEALKAEIAELRKPADGTLVGQLSGFLTVLASYAHITGDQGEKLRWAASLLLSLQRDLVELRKPVAVERNETVERFRDQCKQYAATWGGDTHIISPNEVSRLFDAYDTLAQNHAREFSAREAIAAEMRGLRQRISSMQLKAAEVAHDYCGRLVAARERERQLREALEKFRAIPVSERLPTHIYTVFIYVIDDIDAAYWDVGIYNAARDKWQSCDGEEDRDVEVSHWIDQPDDPRAALAASPAPVESAALAQPQATKFCEYEDCDGDPATGSTLCQPHIDFNAQVAAEERQQDQRIRERRAQPQDSEPLCLAESAATGKQDLPRCLEYPDCICGGPQGEQQDDGKCRCAKYCHVANGGQLLKPDGTPRECRGLPGDNHPMRWINRQESGNG